MTSTQTILFQGDGGVTASIEIKRVDADAEALAMVARYHPEQADRGEDRLSAVDPDELADALEAMVEDHFGEARSRVRIIRWSDRPAYLEVRHLSRYAVPMLVLDKGRG